MKTTTPITARSLSTDRHWHWLVVFLAFAVCASAGQVVRDGTVGPAGALPGSAFVIPDTDGQTRGNNLFHSFSRFNLDNGDTATFTGPANILNILCRVTGGASTIDGTIDSTAMPNANFFFINPFGVTFGQHAFINVGGSFAVTTADYVKLADGGRFDARRPANDVLTAAPPSAFGFLGPAAPVAINGVVEDPNNPPFFTFLPDGKNLWLVGGDVTVRGDILAAPGGQFIAVATASAGELPVELDNSRTVVDTSAFSALGALTLRDGSAVYVTGAPAGGASLAADRILVSENSGIIAENFGETPGGQIALRARTAIELENVTVSTYTFGGASGSGGEIALAAPTITMTASTINSSTGSDGHGGNISITANEFNMLRSGGIASGASATGGGGDIVLTADHVRIEGKPDTSPGLLNVTFGGAAGSIIVNAQTVELLTGGRLGSDVQAGATAGGNIQVTADRLIADGRNVTDPYIVTGISSRSLYDSTGGGGSIVLAVGQLSLHNGARVTTTTENTAPAGSIDIQSRELTLDTGASIESAATAAGAAGSINLQVADAVQLDHAMINVSSAQGTGGALTINADRSVNLLAGVISAQAAGDGGDITITTPTLALQQASDISASALGSGRGGTVRVSATTVAIADNSSIRSTATGTGPAGSLDITATDNVLLQSGGLVSVSSDQSSGGDITITAGREIRLADSQITGRANNDGGNINLRATSLIYLLRSTVTAASLAGNGGNITIDPTLVVLNNSAIIAQAIEGRGGNINIFSDYFLAADSLIDASSEFGLQGTVVITAPNLNLAGNLLTLPSAPLDAESLLKPHCAVRLPRGTSSFTLSGRGGLPVEPAGLLPAFPITPEPK